MKKALPEAWKEPINEALWRYETLFGCPRWMAFAHVALFVLTLFHHFRWCYAMAIMQAAGIAATLWDPEWPQIIHDWFVEPGEIDP